MNCQRCGAVIDTANCYRITSEIIEVYPGCYRCAIQALKLGSEPVGAMDVEEKLVELVCS